MKLKICIHCLLAAFALTATQAAASLENFDATTEVVGRSTNGFETPVNQLVTPDGNLLVTAGLTHEVVVVDPATGKILQRVSLPSDQAQEPAPVSTTILSPD